MKNASTWMAVLTFTAVVLGAILLSSGGERRAEGAMLNAQANFSLMTSGINGGDEALIVVDKTQQKLIVYTLKGDQLSPLAARKL